MFKHNAIEYRHHIDPLSHVEMSVHDAWNIYAELISFNMVRDPVIFEPV